MLDGAKPFRPRSQELDEVVLNGSPQQASESMFVVDVSEIDGVIGVNLNPLCFMAD
jgi:hypothetical protein